LNGLMMAVTSFMKTLSRIGGLAPGKQTRLKSKRSAWLCNASSAVPARLTPVNRCRRNSPLRLPHCIRHSDCISAWVTEVLAESLPSPEKPLISIPCH
jgi:hypothetical protein